MYTYQIPFVYKKFASKATLRTCQSRPKMTDFEQNVGYK